MAAYRQNSTTPLGAQIAANVQHPLLEKAEACAQAKNWWQLLLVFIHYNFNSVALVDPRLRRIQRVGNFQFHEQEIGSEYM